MEKREGKTLLILAIMTSMLLSIVAIVPASAPAATLGVEPDKIINPALQAGSTFKLEVWVRNVANLAGVEFKLSYNTTILDATLIEYGGIFGGTYFEWIKTINDAEGWLHYSISEYFGEPPFTGDGRVANITFTVDSYGSSVLDLYETALGDEIIPPNPIDHTVLDSYFRNKLTGDADGDRTVNVFDILKVKYHWYPGPPAGAGGYDRDVDCDDDGSINVFDILVVKANWGNSI